MQHDLIYDADRLPPPKPSPHPVRGPEDVERLVGARLRRSRRELFLVILLNGRHAPLGRPVVISIGSLNASIVHPREVFRPAILGPAASVILAHNHPSGDPEPSEEDVRITKQLAQAGELLGVRVVDHIIFAKRGTVSLRARRLL